MQDLNKIWHNQTYLSESKLQQKLNAQHGNRARIVTSNHIQSSMTRSVYGRKGITSVV